jgi:excisionase family DNA binding protein
MDLLDTVDLGVDRPLDASMDTVDVATAAQRLGVPVATVYKRIQRGRLRVQRVDGHVYVVLDRSTDTVDASMDPPSNGHGPVSTPSMDTPEPAAPAAEPSALTLALAEVRGERDHLRAEVERLHERLREAHVLLAQRPALPAPSESTRVDPETVSPDTVSRPWWAALRWWRR